MPADDEDMKQLILEAIEEYPGLHFRGVARELDTSTSLARYHLDQLIDEEKIRSEEVGGYVRYFPTDEFDELSDEGREKLNVLRQEKPLEIVLAILQFGSMRHKELHEIVPGSKGTLTYHLNKLIDADIVRRVRRGEDKGFHLVDEDETRRLAARYRPESGMLDEVHDMWEDLFGGHRDG